MQLHYSHFHSRLAFHVHELQRLADGSRVGAQQGNDGLQIVDFLGRDAQLVALNLGLHLQLRVLDELLGVDIELLGLLGPCRLDRRDGVYQGAILTVSFSLVAGEKNSPCQR